MPDRPARQPTMAADPAALRRQARSAVERGDTAAAILHHISALEIDPGNAEGHFELGTLLFRIGRFEDAVAALEIAAKLAPVNPQVRHNLGLALGKTGATDRARAEFAEAARLAPGEAAYIRALALFDLSIGRADEAETGFRTLIACDPGDSAAHRNLARLARYVPDDPHIAGMESLLGGGGLSLDAGIDLGFALFDALGKAGLHERAFRHLADANRLRRRKFPYDAAGERLVFEQVEGFFGEDFFRDIPPDRSEAAGPIFIVGMPRAGTTLIEQILSSHPDVAAGGESLAMTELVRRFLIAPDSSGLSLSPSVFSIERRTAMRAFYLSAMRDVSERAPCFTDKMPLNFRWIGIIAAILPEARFVHCRRDPVETCFSIHSSFFASGGNRYGHDLDDLADYYRQCHRLMAHWRRMLPVRVLDVELADVVADQEGQTRRLLDFLGLDFEPNCMAFHANRSQVATVSSLQVKKPVYGGHSERLKPYLPFLGPLLALRDET
jgi:Flp pilus assembly protein TadD